MVEKTNYRMEKKEKIMTKTINKFQLDTIYWLLLDMRGMTDLVDTEKLSSIEESMAALAKELGYSTYTDEYIKGKEKENYVS